jgi:hypothetical protein
MAKYYDAKTGTYYVKTKIVNRVNDVHLGDYVVVYTHGGTIDPINMNVPLQVVGRNFRYNTIALTANSKNFGERFYVAPGDAMVVVSKLKEVAQDEPQPEPEPATVFDSFVEQDGHLTTATTYTGKKHMAFIRSSDGAVILLGQVKED